MYFQAAQGPDGMALMFGTPVDIFQKSKYLKHETKGKADTLHDLGSIPGQMQEPPKALVQCAISEVSEACKYIRSPDC